MKERRPMVSGQGKGWEKNENILTLELASVINTLSATAVPLQGRSYYPLPIPPLFPLFYFLYIGGGGGK